MKPNNDLAIVILAAGKGTRLKSSLAKVLHPAGGRSLVEQVLRSCAPLKARKTIVVVGHQADRVTAVAEPLGAQSVLQHPQNGTGTPCWWPGALWATLNLPSYFPVTLHSFERRRCKLCWPRTIRQTLPRRS